MVFFFLFLLCIHIQTLCKEKNDEMIKIRLGGCEMIALIDSGSPVNTLPTDTWEEVKEKMKVFRYSSHSDRVIRAYATGDPLTIDAMFSASVEVVEAEKPTCRAKFYVVRDGGVPLLSKSTSEQLKILKLGVEVKALQLGNLRKMFPRIPDLKVKFKIDETVTPKQIPRVRIPVPLQDAVQKRLDEMEQVGIIEKASENSPWINPIEVVAKGKDDFRIVIDMRKPNEAIQRARYPLPEVSKFHRQLSGAKHFTKLDLKSAFHHIELDEESRDITTFMTPRGLMRFTRLLFGVNTAPEIFQREMERLFRSCEGIIIFIDDILIFAKTIEELSARVRDAERVIALNNLTLNNDKCKYSLSEVEFLGMKINGDGFRPGEDKIEAIKNFKTPESISEVRSFLGLVTHLGQYLKDLATVSEPLRDLTKKNIEWKWEEQEEKAFRELQRMIVNDIVQHGFFHPKLETQLFVDASPVGLGAVLMQRQKKGKLQVVAYAAKSLTETEKRYPQNQREALAVVWGVEKFGQFLLGSMFKIFTDNKAVQFLFGGKERDNKRAITRAEGWVLRLSSYNFEMKFIKGEENVADPLSRLCKPGDKPFEDSDKNQELWSIKSSINAFKLETPRPVYVKALSDDKTQVITLEKVAIESKKDKLITVLREALTTDIWPDVTKNYRPFAEEMFFQGEILVRGHRVILPASLQQSAIEITHLSHAGVNTMKRALRERVWWSGLDADVETYVKKCKSCTQMSVCNAPPPMTRTEMPKAPFDFIAIDFFSPGEKEKVLVVTDYHSRMLICAPIASNTTEKTIEALEKVFAVYGIPLRMKADNGPPFQGEEFAAFCEQTGIDLVHSVPYWAQQNGQAERCMKMVRRSLMAAKLERKNWKIALQNLEFTYNNSPHTQTGKAPAEVFFGRKVRGLLPLFDREQNFLNEDEREKDKIEKFKGKLKMDEKRRAKPHDIRVGDTVLILNKEGGKLTPRFGSKLFKVIERNEGKLGLESEEGVKVQRYVAQVKKWPLLPSDDVTIEPSASLDTSENSATNHESNEETARKSTDNENESISEANEFSKEIGVRPQLPRRSERNKTAVVS